jgi:hypothetical protein
MAQRLKRSERQFIANLIQILAGLRGAMSVVVIKGLQDLTTGINLKTGVIHPSDLNAAKEMFLRLHEVDEPLLAHEIEKWALQNGWQLSDAARLGRLGATPSGPRRVFIRKCRR